MKNILIYSMLFVCLNGFSQNSNTFFATKLSDNNKVKLVFTKGDKLKVKYLQSGTTLALKGKLNEIHDRHIVVDTVKIELTSIEEVSAHKPGIKVLGGILFASGSALIVKGINRKQNPITITKGSDDGKFDFFPEKTVVRNGTGLIVFGSILCGISAVGIITPIYCNKNKFRFSTNVTE